MRKITTVLAAAGTAAAAALIIVPTTGASAAKPTPPPPTPAPLHVTQVGAAGTSNDGGIFEVSATCPAGMVLTGGGNINAGTYDLVSSGPASTSTGPSTTAWRVVGRGLDPSRTFDVVAFAFCVTGTETVQ